MVKKSLAFCPAPLIPGTRIWCTSTGCIPVMQQGSSATRAKWNLFLSGFKDAPAYYLRPEFSKLQSTIPPL